MLETISRAEESIEREEGGGRDGDAASIGVDSGDDGESDTEMDIILKSDTGR
tara:strand:+ start:671 stop:826 length:156 start_codon:yes stop_codon:yes gene_type:complete